MARKAIAQTIFIRISIAAPIISEQHELNKVYDTIVHSLFYIFVQNAVFPAVMMEQVEKRVKLVSL